MFTEQLEMGYEVKLFRNMLLKLRGWLKENLHRTDFSTNLLDIMSFV